MSICTKFRDHARALLLMLGYDPNPANLAKLEGIPVPGGIKISLMDKDYLVYDNLNLLEPLVLSKPFALPSRYLALFIYHAFREDVDFAHCIQIAENFKKNPTDNSLWSLRALIEKDPFLSSHIEEMLVNEYAGVDAGVDQIAKINSFDFGKFQIYRDRYFWIFGFTPKSRILELLGDQKCNQN